MSKKFVKKFGLRVKNIREEKSISQEELADMAGLHRTQISLIERGMRTPRLETIEKLADALGIQPSELIPEK